MKRWINKKVVFEWNGTRYVEVYADKYLYEGELALADVLASAGHGAGGGGGAGGNGGVVVLITSNLSQKPIDDGWIEVSVAKGQKGVGGYAGAAFANGNAGNHGSDANNAANGVNMTVIV